MLLTAMVLASSLASSTNCSQKLSNFESMLSQWSSETRHVTVDYEQHRYHTVKRDGTTVFMTVVATRESLAYWRFKQGFTLDSACTFDGTSGAILYKVETKK